MATVVNPNATIIAGETWELPKDRPWLAKMGRLARENPIGAVSLLVVIGFVFLGIVGASLVPYAPRELDATSQFLSPSLAHPFGTTKFGQDIFSRILAGARIDLKFGFVILFFEFNVA